MANLFECVNTDVGAKVTIDGVPVTQDVDLSTQTNDSNLFTSIVDNIDFGDSTLTPSEIISKLPDAITASGVDSSKFYYKEES